MDDFKKTTENAMNRYYQRLAANQFKKSGTQAITPAVSTLPKVEEKPVKPENKKGNFFDELGYFFTKGFLDMFEVSEDMIEGVARWGAQLIGKDDWAEKTKESTWLDYDWADKKFNVSDDSLLKKTRDFDGYVGRKFNEGLGKSLEGTGDYLVGLGAEVSGNHELAERLMLNDATNLYADKRYADAGKGTKFVGDVAQGIGNMLPSIALNAIPGVGPILSKANFAISAAGQATSEKAQENGKLGFGEWGYGTTMGALEGAIEAASGGTGKYLGKATGKVFGKQIAKSTAGKLATNVIGEGLEEVASDLADPLVQKAFGVTDKDLGEMYGETIKDLPKTFAVGAATGGVMGGASTAMQAKAVGGVKNLNAIENATEFNNALSENNVRQEKGKSAAYSQRYISNEQQRVSETLKKADDETRAKIFKQAPRLKLYFNNDGSVNGTQVQEKTAEQRSPSGSFSTAPMRASIKNIDGKDIVVVDTDQDIFDGVDRSEYGKIARNYIKEHFRGKKLGRALVSSRSEKEYTRSKYSQRIYNESPNIYDTKMKSATELDNFVKTADFIGHEEAKHSHIYNESGYNRYKVEFELGGQQFSGEMLIALDKNNEGLFYDIVNIKEKSNLRYHDAPKTGNSQGGKDASTPIIRKSEKKVNTLEEKSFYDIVNVNEKADEKSLTSRLKGPAISASSLSATPIIRKSEKKVNTLEEKIFYDIVNIKERAVPSEPKTRRVETASFEDISVNSFGNKSAPASSYMSSIEEKSSTPIIRKSEKKVNTLEEKSLEKVNRPVSSASVKGKEGELRHAPASEVRSDIAVMLKDVMTISDGNIDYVVTDDLGDTNGYYDPDSGIMYLSNNAEIEGLRSFVVGHEYTHSLEGTEEYTKLGNAILKRISEDKELSKKYDIQDYAVRYVLDAEKSGKKYSEEQYKYIAQTELVADFVGKEMLSNEATIKRIESRNKGIVSKLLQWVKDKISILKSKKGTERDTLKFLLKAEKMLSNAIGASVGGFDVAEIDNKEGEEKTNDLETANVRSSIKTDSIGKYLSIDLNSDDQKKFSLLPTKDRSAFIKSYINSKFRNIEFTLSDNSKVVITSTGAGKIANANFEPKQRTALELEKIFSIARKIGSDENVNHIKFTRFDYYSVRVQIGDNIYSCVLNIGTTKRSNLYQLYDINQFEEIKKEAPGQKTVQASANGVRQVRNASSTDSIFDKNEKVNTFEEKSLEKNVNIRKSLKIEPDYKLLDTYNEKQYNDFGWARVNGVLSKKENADFVSKYRRVKLGLQRETHKTANGEIIVAVNDGTDKAFGINNVLVYAKGSFENYKITKVVRLNLDNETALEYVRDFIYEICSNRRKQAYQESNSFEDIFDEGLIRSFVRESMPSYQDSKREARRRTSGDNSGEDNGNNQVEQDGRRDLVENREDKGLNTRKSLKQIRYIPYYKIGYNNIEKIRREVWNLYSGIESGVADGIAINIDNSIYVLDTSKDDGEICFAVRKVLIADDESLAMEVIRRINNDAISKRYISDGLSSRIRYEYDNGSRSSLQRESGEKLSDNQGQSKDNEVGISTENGVGRSIGSLSPSIRYSVKSQAEMEADEISRKIIEEMKEKHQLSEDEIKTLQTIIKEETREQFKVKNRKRGLFQHLRNHYSQKWIDEIKKTRYKIKVIDTAVEARDLIRRTYTSASILENAELKDFLKLVSRFKHGAAIPLTVRDKVANLKAVYTKENLSFVKEEADVANGESSSTVSPISSCYDSNVADAIEFISEKAGTNDKLALDELQALYVVSKGLIHLYKDFNTILRGDERIAVDEVAEKGIETIEKRHTDNSKKSFWGKLTSGAKTFIINNVDPFAVAQYIDGFDDAGQMTASINEIRAGETKAQLYEMDMLSNFDAFFKKNKKYHRRLKEKIKLSNGVELTIDQAMQVYLLSKREQANLFEAGIVLKDQGTVKITEEDVKEISKNFSEADLEYIKIAHKVFNEDVRSIKVETDEKLYGYSILEDGDDYIPAYRDRDGLPNVLGEVKDFFVDATSSATNPPFNRKTKQGAKLPLRVNGLSEVVARHVHAVAIYAGLAIPIRSFNKLYNAVIGDKSMRKVANSLVWNGTYRYFNKVLLDMQGIMQKGADKVLSYLRGSYAKFQLGFNLKSVLSQLASYPMAFTYLDFSVLSKGLFMRVDKEKMYKYAPSSRARVEDKTVIKAQSLSTKVNKLSDIFTKPMQKMDAFVVSRIWNACQLQIQKEKGHKVGTEENLKLAGELTEKVVNETQSNSKAGERSEWSRSQNILISSLTLFTSDAQKQTSRLFVAIGKLKHAKNAQEKASARKLFAKTATAITMSHLTYVLIAIAMADLLGRLEDEDKDGKIADDALKFGANQFGSQVVGMLPIFRDLYSYFVDGFDMDNYAINMVNDTLSATKSILELGSNVIKGKPMSRTEMARPLRQFIYAVGQLTGIPARNIYNYVFGVINKFNPEVAYKTNSLFYNNTSWKRDMQEAYAAGDVSFANTIAKTEIINRANFDDDKVVAELARLSVEGYSVMPNKIVEKITIDDEEYTLSAEMQRLYAKTISGEEQAIKELISTAGYAKLSNDEKADAIEYIQTYFKYKAKNRVDKNSAIPTKYLLAEKIGLKNVAVYLSAIKSIVAEKDAKGNIIKTRKEKVEEYVNSLKISAVEKYLLMLLAGYKLNKTGKDKVLPYIKSMAITNVEKTKLLELAA